MQQAKDGGMSPRALLQNADKLAKELEAQLERQAGGGGGGGGSRFDQPPPGGGGGGGGGGPIDLTRDRSNPPPVAAMVPGMASRDGSEEHFPVPQDMAGAVIGKMGETVKDIQNQSGAHLTMSKEPDHNGNRMVALTGTPQQVKMAKEMIIKILIDAKQRAAKAGRRHGEEIIIPDKSVGLILGKQGGTIKAIQERSGARISLDDAPRGTPQRVVTVQGGEMQIAAARAEILELVRSGEEADQRKGGMGGMGGGGGMMGGPPGGMMGGPPRGPPPPQSGGGMGRASPVDYTPQTAASTASAGSSSGWSGSDDTVSEDSKTRHICILHLCCCIAAAPSSCPSSYHDATQYVFATPASLLCLSSI